MTVSNENITVGSLVPQKPPAVSVIIPNYNTAIYIAETLDSVFAQTFEDLEVIVINDAAPDTTELLEILRPYNEKIVFINLQQNLGTSAARNLAVEYARAPVLAFLDADDIWLPAFLDELYTFLIKHDFDMTYAAAETFGLAYATTENFLGLNPPQGEITRRMLVEGRCLILPSGAIIRKQKFLDLGGFDPQIARTEDFDLWMRMLFNETRIGYLKKILFRFRIRPGSGSGDTIQRIERSRSIWLSLQERLPFTEEEDRLIDRHVLHADADILRALGRIQIVQRNWPEARSSFSKALKLAGKLGLPLKHRLKIASVLFLLRVYPELLLKLFQEFRRDEIEYMPVADPKISGSF